MVTALRAVPILKVTKAVAFRHMWLSVSDMAQLVKCLKNELDPQKKLDVVVHT